EFVVAMGQVAGDDLTRGVEVDEDEFGRRLPQQIAVGAFERRAGDDRGRCACCLGGDAVEPRCPFLIGARYTGAHLRLVRRGVEIVGVDEATVEGLCHLRAEDGLAGSRDTHDDQWWKRRGLTHVRNLSIKYEEMSTIVY